MVVDHLINGEGLTMANGFHSSSNNLSKGCISTRQAGSIPASSNQEKTDVFFPFVNNIGADQPMLFLFLFTLIKSSYFL